MSVAPFFFSKLDDTFHGRTGQQSVFLVGGRLYLEIMQDLCMPIMLIPNTGVRPILGSWMTKKKKKRHEAP